MPDTISNILETVLLELEFNEVAFVKCPTKALAIELSKAMAKERRALIDIEGREDLKALKIYTMPDSEAPFRIRLRYTKPAVVAVGDKEFCIEEIAMGEDTI